MLAVPLLLCAPVVVPFPSSVRRAARRRDALHAATCNATQRAALHSSLPQHDKLFERFSG